MEDLTQIKIDGARLKYYRELRGLTQGKTGAAAGVSKAAISKYELDNGTPSGNVLARLCLLLNVNIPDITTKAA